MLKFLKDWTLPVSIATGTLCYLLFCHIPALDAAAEWFGWMFDIIFPFFVFLTLLVTFCKVDFHQMRPHRWHLWVLVAQIMLVALNLIIIFIVYDNDEQKIMWEGVLTCIIGPSASAAPVITGKLGGNISTMTTFTLISSLASAFMIPVVFPLLEHEAQISFIAAFLVILEKLAIVLVLPLALGYMIRHYARSLHRRIVSKPNLGFYFWGVSLAITTGITVKNIVHSDASLTLLVMIAVLSLVVCFVQFGIGRTIGRHFGEKINSGQAMFQKNTALSIWVAYMYLNPVASIGAGCYVLWQNIINSLELWEYRNGKLK
ncbi:bile acid:sodium symporter family protein [Prevotella sp. OH937_COT-195]|uniref:bile acid:sodium symporter family protein n=1 Tax=Prevotella sp. OH937_COT-195 TaxID=2491051 RepID=UPI000F651660|nr:bile acid:sodium symporter [Prevotella sp. OH937_COT-195]RRD02787.1 transporter [Prevotella sp. OH937_COT-195]